MPDEGTMRERATLAMARANVYNFLAAAYGAAPSVEVAESILDGTLPKEFAAFQSTYPYLTELKQALAGVDSVQLTEELAVEYTRLFVGPGPGYVAPYQSVYADCRTIETCGMQHFDLPPSSRTVKGLLWGESTVTAARRYSEAGLEPLGELAGVPDHVAVELQFMQYLCAREAAALYGERPEQASLWARREGDFLREHLALWVKALGARIIANARHPWYRAVAALTMEFIADEATEAGQCSVGTASRG